MAAELSYVQRLVAAARLADLDIADATIPSPEEVAKKCSEWGITAEMKPHQNQGISWLIRRYLRGVNVILGDEMGLGKTLQAISFLSYLKSERKCRGPFLVLCPLSVTAGWMSEFAKFSPRLRVLSYVGDKEQRLEMRKSIVEYVTKRASKSNEFPFDVLLSTYDLAILDASFLSHIRWHYAIIDEAQRIKNPSSVLYNTLQNCFMSPRRLLMTGTPVQNNLSELWALLYFCMPRVFGKLEDFVATFKQTADENTAGDENQFKLLRYIVHAFMLRRTKALLVQKGFLTLPPLSEVTVMAPLVPLQKKIYVSVLHKELPKLLMGSTGTLQNQSLQNIIVQLRKTCSHPYLFNGVEPEPFEEGEHLVQASGKLLILDALLQKLHSDGHRVLVFAQMTRTLDILQDYLELRRYSYERLDGSVRAEERFAAVQSFSGKSSGLQEADHVENLDSGSHKAFVFLISTRAGGVGLNLVAADTVIFYEQDWNPQVDKQALQRAHRIGQMHHVLAISIVTENTVEEVIMCRAKAKLQLTHNIIGHDDFDVGAYKSEDVASNDLRSMVIFGLHKFDPLGDVERSSNEISYPEMKSMVEKVLETRLYASADMGNERFKIDSRGRRALESIYMYNGNDVFLGEHIGKADLENGKDADEAAFQLWMNKVKDGSLNGDLVNYVRGRKRVSSPSELEDARAQKRKKEEEKKLAKWEALGYKSLTVSYTSERSGIEASSDSGEVQFVFGDCTHPLKCHPDEETIIFSCVDNSGIWGSGGMFDALSNMSEKVPDVYRKAHECQDLHLGDLHLIQVSDEQQSKPSNKGSQWVALAVVQTYNARRKVPRSDISLDHLEDCLKKASNSAFQKSASVHMPRIGFHSGDKHTEWYTVERLLHKYAAIYSIKIYVYYYKRAGRRESDVSVLYD